MTRTRAAATAVWEHRLMSSVTTAEFRRLARSSPWLWRTLEFRWGGAQDETRHAWIRRPGSLRVEDDRGGLVEAVAETRPFPGARADFGWGWEPKPGRWPSAVEPEFASDGLVEVVPDAFDIDYDSPFFRNYHWVAMLNPVEFARGEWDDGHAVELSEPSIVDHHGREAWQVTARSTPGYEPTCECCALLAGRFDFDLQVWVPGPPSVIRLDRQTGLCVWIEGDGPAELDVEILAVDQPLGDDLFRRP
ncbi:hypothetical protein [Nocardia nova]|nr:hypothetical protein [Nocardia nova]